MCANPVKGDPMTSPHPLARSFAAFLFDMDGTLLDSTTVANRVWRDWAEGHGLDAEQVIAVLHGVRVRDTVQRFATGAMDVNREAERITAAEIAQVDGIAEIAQARAFLESLPHDRWAVVTSAPRALATRRIEAAGLPSPPLLVTAEDIVNGKPAPDCYIAAAKALGVEIRDCLVWEDAPAGIAAAEAAGATVIVVEATHADPDNAGRLRITNFCGLSCSADADGMLRLYGASQARGPSPDCIESGKMSEGRLTA